MLPLIYKTGVDQTARNGPIQRRPVAIDVFSGAGGMSLGMEAAGFDVAVAVDNDPVHLATYQYNFPFTRAIYASAADLSGSDILSKVETGLSGLASTEGWDGRVDCLFGGPPCQSFSNMGKRDPNDSRGALIEEFARLVCEIRPRSFVMENVPGLLQPEHRPALHRVLDEVRRADYTLTSGGPIILDAPAFGVPQRRRRVFLVGVSRDTGPAHPPVGNGFLTNVGSAIGDLVDADLFEELLSSDETTLDAQMIDDMESGASSYAQEMRRSRYGPLGYSRRWERQLLTSSMRTRHSPEVTERYRMVRPGEICRASRQPRLASDRLAPTLRAGAGSDRGSYTSCRPIHPRHHRVITVREGARLHGFPDWFRFHRTKWHGFRQVGNAVPPPLAQAVATEVARALNVLPEQPRQTVEMGDALTLGLNLTEAHRHLSEPACQVASD